MASLQELATPSTCVWHLGLQIVVVQADCLSLITVTCHAQKRRETEKKLATNDAKPTKELGPC